MKLELGNIEIPLEFSEEISIHSRKFLTVSLSKESGYLGILKQGVDCQRKVLELIFQGCTVGVPNLGKQGGVVVFHILLESPILDEYRYNSNQNNTDDDGKQNFSLNTNGLFHTELSSLIPTGGCKFGESAFHWAGITT